jgi:hypothetical protein
MILEQLTQQKEKYQDKQVYFKNIGFDNLAADFQNVVDLIGEMENYIKEKENGKD